MGYATLNVTKSFTVKLRVIGGLGEVSIVNSDGNTTSVLVGSGTATGLFKLVEDVAEGEITKMQSASIGEV